MAQNSIQGVYELYGMREMGGGFKFDTDGTFEFYYVYGAVDRIAKGTFKIEGDTIKLHSQKKAGSDFEIKSQKKQGKGYHLVISDPNKYLIGYIKCLAMKGTEKMQYESSQEGIIQIPEDKLDKIYVQHELFPDIYTLIKDESNSNNYFELGLKPSLAEVSFQGIDLIIEGDILKMMPNYFLPYPDIVFRKSE